MQVKELFDSANGGALTWEQFESMMRENNSKFVDLNEGNYVSRQKYEDELGQRDTRISTLTNTITARDTDLTNLRNTLKDAGDLDALKSASKDLEALQRKYDKETKEYQERLSKQAYEFAVKEFANTKQFTSNAAKRDFTQSMIAKNLSMEDNRIIGAEDFVQMYTANNQDAFVVDVPAQNTQSNKPRPQFIESTNSATPPVESNAFVNAFNFMGVRAKEEK